MMNSLLMHFKLIRPSLMKDVDIDPNQNYAITEDPAETETEPLSKWTSLVSSYKSIVFKTAVTTAVSYVLTIKFFLCKYLLFQHGEQSYRAAANLQAT